MTFTHYGWFGFCPVKIGALDTEAPIVVARWWWLEPVFWLAELHESLVIGLRSVFMPDVEPVFALKVGRRITEPQSASNEP
jgi:hypothetical protein